jgi:hypothetical protein
VLSLKIKKIILIQEKIYANYVYLFYKRKIDARRGGKSHPNLSKIIKIFLSIKK